MSEVPLYGRSICACLENSNQLATQDGAGLNLLTVTPVILHRLVSPDDELPNKTPRIAIEEECWTSLLLDNPHITPGRCELYGSPQ